MKNVYVLVFMSGLFNPLLGQNLTTRSSQFEVDMSTAKQVSGDIPVITWEQPIPDINFSEQGKFPIKFTVQSTSALTSVTIAIKEKDLFTVRGTLTLKPTELELNRFLVEKNLTLQNGENVIQITAENEGGIKTTSAKNVSVGAEAIANASRLDRADYALLFGTDKYAYWNGLVNPIFDSRAIAENLRTNYGFKVEVVENATQQEVLKKLREYAEKKYKPLDQLFVFFAGHGNYDETFGEGYVVTTEALANDEGKTSYLPHSRIRTILNNIPCEHIFLTMDVCFGGTFDEKTAAARGDVYEEQGRSEFISRKLISKTRKYLTSGGKTYVSDGIAGQHSPFAKNFLEALDSKGGKDGILTFTELFTYVEKLKIQPRQGNFGDNAPNSDFLFITK